MQDRDDGELCSRRQRDFTPVTLTLHDVYSYSQSADSDDAASAVLAGLWGAFQPHKVAAIMGTVESGMPASGCCTSVGTC